MGELSLVVNDLYPDSPLYTSQKKLIQRLYQNQITESVVDYLVDNVRIQSDG